MLVGGRVENQRRPVDSEDRLHAVFIADVGDAGNDAQAGKHVGQLEMRLKEAIFRTFDEKQRFGTQLANEAAQLRADAAAGAGHEDGLVLHNFADEMAIEVHRGTAQQIFEGHLADAREIDAALDDFVQRGNDLGVEAVRLAQLDNLADGAPRALGDRDESMVDVETFGNRGEIGRCSQHGYAADAHAGETGIVIQETDRKDAEVRTAGDFLGGHGAGPAGADQQGGNALRACQGRSPLAVLVKEADRAPQSDQAQEAQHQIEQDHADGQADGNGCRVRRPDAMKVGKQAPGEQQNRRGAAQVEDQHRVAQTRVPPGRAPAAADREKAQFTEQDERQIFSHDAEHPGGDFPIEAQ